MLSQSRMKRAVAGAALAAVLSLVPVAGASAESPTRPGDSGIGLERTISYTGLEYAESSANGGLWKTTNFYTADQ